MNKLVQLVFTWRSVCVRLWRQRIATTWPWSSVLEEIWWTGSVRGTGWRRGRCGATPDRSSLQCSTCTNMALYTGKTAHTHRRSMNTMCSISTWTVWETSASYWVSVKPFTESWVSSNCCFSLSSLLSDWYRLIYPYFFIVRNSFDCFLRFGEKWKVPSKWFINNWHR